MKKRKQKLKQYIFENVVGFVGITNFIQKFSPSNKHMKKGLLDQCFPSPNYFNFQHSSWLTLEIFIYILLLFFFPSNIYKYNFQLLTCNILPPNSIIYKVMYIIDNYYFLLVIYRENSIDFFLFIFSKILKFIT